MRITREFQPASGPMSGPADFPRPMGAATAGERARPDLMAKLEKLVDVDASLRAGRLVARLSAYPHQGGCDGCREARVCNYCGETMTARCTNGRCMDCHGQHCTLGGSNGLGHGYGTAGSVNHLESAR